MATILIITLKNNEEEVIPQILSAISNEIDLQTVTPVLYPILSFQNLKIDTYQKNVQKQNRQLKLSASEYRLLEYLTSSPGRVFTRSQIYEVVWNEKAGDPDNSVMCLISSLRKKIEVNPAHPTYIHTVRGMGYKFEAVPEE